MDSCSTHNFIQGEVVENLKFVFYTIKPFKVSIGSGEKLVCDKAYRTIDIIVQGVTTTMDLFLLPMAGKYSHW